MLPPAAPHMSGIVPSTKHDRVDVARLVSKDRDLHVATMLPPYAGSAEEAEVSRPVVRRREEERPTQRLGNIGCNGLQL